MDRDTMIPVAIFLVVIACLMLSIIGLEYAECNAKTAEIGFGSRFSVFGGCQIEVNPGQWIPLDAYYFKQE